MLSPNLSINNAEKEVIRKNKVNIPILTNISIKKKIIGNSCILKVINRLKRTLNWF